MIPSLQVRNIWWSDSVSVGNDQTASLLISQLTHTQRTDLPQTNSDWQRWSVHELLLICCWSNAQAHQPCLPADLQSVLIAICSLNISELFCKILHCEILVDTKQILAAWPLARSGEETPCCAESVLKKKTKNSGTRTQTITASKDLYTSGASSC